MRMRWAPSLSPELSEGILGRLSVEVWNSLFSKVASVSEGTINMLTDKGYGFSDTEKGDLFFHMSAVQDISYDELCEGETVE